MFTSYYVARFLNGVDYDSIEIGVHHGKYFIALENLTPKNARCIAIDIFEDQQLNIDSSGHGSLSIFRKNVDKYCINPRRVEPISMDSVDIHTSSLGKNRFGLVSVDGGHTARHTVSDLLASSELVHSRGLVILDDILNQDWAGVVTGAVEFFSGSNSGRLVPVAIGFNKLFCCHFSRRDEVLKAILDDEEILHGIGLKQHRITEFAGHQVLSLHSV